MSYNTFTVDFLYVMISKYFQTRGYQKNKKKQQRKNKDRIQKRTCKKHQDLLKRLYNEVRICS